MTRQYHIFKGIEHFITDISLFEEFQLYETPQDTYKNTWNNRRSLFIDHYLNPKRTGLILSKMEEITETEEKKIVCVLSLLTPEMLNTDINFFMLKEGQLTNDIDDWASYYYPYAFKGKIIFNSITDMAYQKFLEQEARNVQGWFLLDVDYKHRRNPELFIAEGSVEFVSRVHAKSFLKRASFFCSSENEIKNRLSILEKAIAINEEAPSDYSVATDILDIAEADQNTNNEIIAKKIIDSHVFPNTTDFSVKILNVGEANAVEIRGNHWNAYNMSSVGNPSALYFDLGLPVGSKDDDAAKKNPDLNNKGVAYIKRIQLTSDVIILSHWHWDHFAQLIDNPTLDAAIVIAEPVPDMASKSAKDLEKYLRIRGRLIVIHNDREGEIINAVNGNVVLYQSKKYPRPVPYEGSGDYINNNSNLILKINGTVFAGDTAYKYWPNDLVSSLREVDKLVVPHHGSHLHTSYCTWKNGTPIPFPNADASENQDIIDNNNILSNKFDNNRSKDAYICVGINSHKHPDKGHIKHDLLRDPNYLSHWHALKNANFCVKETGSLPRSSQGYQFSIQKK